MFRHLTWPLEGWLIFHWRIADGTWSEIYRDESNSLKALSGGSPGGISPFHLMGSTLRRLGVLWYGSIIRRVLQPILWYLRAREQVNLGHLKCCCDSSLNPVHQFMTVAHATAAALVNELVEAKQNNQVRKLMMRWQKYELIALDEVGYVPLADIGRGVPLSSDLGAC
jgi:hypothetical protein